MSESNGDACATVVEILVPGPQGPGGGTDAGIGGHAVAVDDLAAGDALVFDGEVWENRPLASGGDMTKAVYDADGDGKVDAAAVADAVAWAGVTDKPADFPPAAHGHAIADVAGLAAALAGAGGVAGPETTLAGALAFFNDTTGTLLSSGEDTMTSLTVALTAIADAISDNAGTGGGGSLAWSDVTGKPAAFPPAAHGHVLADVAELEDALAGKASLASPAFTGEPTAPTAEAGTNSTRLATTAFVAAAVAAGSGGGGSPAWSDVTGKPDAFPPAAHGHAIADVTGLTDALAAKAPLASPAFTGEPTAPTAEAGTNSTRLATTAFVAAAVAAGSGGGGSLAWSDITGKPDAFPPAAHGHAIADVTGLTDALAAKADAAAIPAPAPAATLLAGADEAAFVTAKAVADANAPVALDASAATVSIDLAAGVNFALALPGNRTLANPDNARAGQSGSIRVTRTTAPATLSFGSAWAPAGGSFAISEAVGEADLVTFLVVAPGTVVFSVLNGFTL
ncbi:MAG: hypothetical protein ACOYJQ_05365 [Pseudochelatococcus sp.]|jgi:hypothetical protein|uniref:hypothetical protein n=1 Tax=Pseudochelatococcus sp. TaxID=2020869 RepID=UPI003D8FB0A5